MLFLIFQLCGGWLFFYGIANLNSGCLSSPNKNLNLWARNIKLSAFTGRLFNAGVFNLIWIIGRQNYKSHLIKEQDPDWFRFWIRSKMDRIAFTQWFRIRFKFWYRCVLGLGRWIRFRLCWMVTLVGAGALPSSTSRIRSANIPVPVFRSRWSRNHLFNKYLLPSFWRMLGWRKASVET